MAAGGELPDPCGGDRHAVLVVLHLAGNAHNHPTIVPYPVPAVMVSRSATWAISLTVRTRRRPSRAAIILVMPAVVQGEGEWPRQAEQVREPRVHHSGVRHDDGGRAALMRGDDPLEGGVHPRGERRHVDVLGQQPGEHPLPGARVEPRHLVHGDVVRGVGVVLAQVVDDHRLPPQRGGQRRRRAAGPGERAGVETGHVLAGERADEPFRLPLPQLREGRVGGPAGAVGRRGVGGVDALGQRMPDEDQLHFSPCSTGPARPAHTQALHTSAHRAGGRGVEMDVRAVFP